MKRLLDLVLSTAVLILSLPFIALVAFLIKVTSRGPVLFRQRRVGKGGSRFFIYKFRTMVEDAPSLKRKFARLNEADGPVFKIRNDPRYTKVGRFLAHTGLDEIPQIFNVLAGEMSFVGPRPLPAPEARKLSARDKAREKVLPGITSLWVVKGAHELKFREWMELDRYYVENQSVLLDLKIILRTFFLVCKIIIDKTIFPLFLASLFYLAIAGSGVLLKGAVEADYSLHFWTVAGVLGAFTFASSWRRQLRAPKILVFLWIAFILASAASSAQSASQALSVPYVFSLIAVFVLWLASVALVDTRARLLSVAKTLVLSVGFLSLVSGYFIVRWLLWGHEPLLPGMNLVWASFGHSHLADLIILVLAASLYAFRDKRVSYGIFAFLFLSFLLTFSRGAFLVFALTILIFQLIRRRAFLPRLAKLLAFPLLLVVLVGAISAFSAFWAKPAGDGWLYRQFVKPMTLGDRPDYWRQAFEVWRDSPVLGSGPDTFRFASLAKLSHPSVKSWFVHNHYLEMFAEVGLAGGLAFLLLVFFSLLIMYQTVKSGRDRLAVALFIGALASSFHSFIDFDWKFLLVFSFFWIVHALILGANRNWEKRAFLTKSIVLVLSLSLLLASAARLAGRFYLNAWERVLTRSGVEQAQKIIIRGFKLYPFSVSGAKLVLTASLWDENGNLREENLRAKAIVGDDPEFWAWLAAGHTKKEERQEALEKTVRIAPLSYPKLLHELAKIYGAKGDLEKELGILQGYVNETWPIEDFEDSSQEASKLYIELAKVLFREGNYSQALDIQARAVQIFPHEPAYYTELGIKERAQKLLQMGRAEEAKKLLNRFFEHTKGKELVELNEAHRYVAESYNLLADIYFAEGSWEQGAEVLGAAVKKDPWNAWYYYSLGANLKRLDRNNEAKEVYQECLKIMPEDVGCQENLLRLEL